jgi:hypothetical protein
MKKLLVIVIIISIVGGVYYWQTHTTGGAISGNVTPVKIEGNSQQREDIIKQNIERARADLRTCGVGAESYFVDNKTYPDNLTQLTTPIAYLTAIPKDVFTEGSFVQYKKVGNNSYLIWSIGADGKDDGGQVAYDTTKGLESAGDMIRTNTTSN